MGIEFFALLLLATATPPAAELEVVARVPSAAPMAGALGPSGVLYVGEGHLLRRLFLTPKGLDDLGAIELSGCALEVEPFERGAFVACGATGLDWVEGQGAVSIPGPAGGVCVDVEVESDSGAAYVLWARGDHYVVQVLDASTRNEITRFEGTGEGARAIVAAPSPADVICIALGTSGVDRIEGALLGIPEGSRYPGPEGFDARDLTVAGGRVWAAGGEAGVLGLPIERRFGPRTRPIVRPVVEEGRKLFAVRVAAAGKRLVVGTQGVPGSITDSNPYGHLGPFGVNLVMGGANLKPYTPFPKLTRMPVFEVQPRGGLKLIEKIQTPHGAYRSLDYDGERLLVLRPSRPLFLKVGKLPPFTRKAGAGVTPIDTLPLRGGDRALVGYDRIGAGQSSAIKGLRGDAPSREPKEVAHNGQTFEALWRSEAGRDVAVVGGWYAPQIVDPFAGTRVPLVLPPDAEGRRGHTYLHSVAFGPWVAISRTGSDDGVVVFAKTALEAQLDGGDPAEPVAVVDTSGGDLPGAWQSAAVPDGDGAWLIATAAGARLSAGVLQARLIVHRFDGERILRTGEALLEGGPARAVSIETVVRDGTPYAVVSSIGGALEIFDLTRASRPRRAALLTVPRDPFDGTGRALTDTAIGRARDGRPMLYVAAGRAGVARFDLDRVLGGGRGLPDQILPLGGWTVGVSVVPETGRVLAACQKGGLAVLAERVPEPGDADFER